MIQLFHGVNRGLDRYRCPLILRSNGPLNRLFFQNQLVGSPTFRDGLAEGVGRVQAVVAAGDRAVRGFGDPWCFPQNNGQNRLLDMVNLPGLKGNLEVFSPTASHRQMVSSGAGQVPYILYLVNSLNMTSSFNCVKV